MLSAIGGGLIPATETLGDVDKKSPQQMVQFQDESESGNNSSLFENQQTVRSIEVSATLPDYPQVNVADYRGYQYEQCVTCHSGIEEVSRSHPQSFGCTVCHGGDGTSLDKSQAHSTLIFDANAGTGRRNPSSLAVVDKTCGQAMCHAGHQQEDRNHIQRVKKSLMGTLAGLISGLRYQWAAQISPKAKYGFYPVRDEDGRVPANQGGLAGLDALPYFNKAEHLEDLRIKGSTETKKISHHIGDSLLRKNCLRCHLDSPAPPGTYRSQGCAACHFQYSADGLYKGGDPTIPKNSPGHPTFHKMSALTPNSTCATCHKTFAENRTAKVAGPNPAIVSKDNSTKDESLPGLGRFIQDVHFAKGLDCIDCHTQFDIMGDGNIYSKQYQAVEIRCETCHGDRSSYPSIAKITDPRDAAIRLSKNYPGFNNAVGDWMVVSERDRKLANVKVVKGKIVTFEKHSGKQHRTPQVRDRWRAHRIPQHMNKLECTSCHSQWVPRCTGCHITLDMTQTSQPRPDGESASKNSWNPFRFSLEMTEPVLMVGPRGKVAPMLSRPQRELNVIDDKGNVLAVMGKTGNTLGKYRQWEFTNPHGYSGGNLAYAMNPHSVSKKVRSCASCHALPKTLGLDQGRIVFGKTNNGKKDRLEPISRSDKVKRLSKGGPEAKGTLHGQPLAGLSQPGARPFNQEEITRILRVGNCLPCHPKYNDRIYRDIEKSYSFEKTQKHRDKKKSFLKKQ